jgi:hypothetical protein
MTERSSTARARRRRPAAGARIVAAGAGTTAMLGIVAAMGFSAGASNASAPVIVGDTPSAMPAVNAPVTTAPATTAPAATTVPPVAPGNGAAPAAPTVLDARPQVRVVAPPPAQPTPRAAPAPVATTRGSS